MIALGDEDSNVRRRACEALWNVGEKAATNEVLKRLVVALGDQNCNVTRGAYNALRKMGEKAAASEGIQKLVVALGHEDSWVRLYACEALGKMGEKAATSEAINRLVTTLGDSKYGVREAAGRAVEKVLGWFWAERQLDAKHVSEGVGSMSIGKSVNSRFLWSWEVLKGSAVTVSGNKIMIYGSSEPLEIHVSSAKLAQALAKACHEQAEKVHGPCEKGRNEFSTLPSRSKKDRIILSNSGGKIRDDQQD
ncbi:unnamed protein product [Didymodactylos carnosus]|uniref:HEAT repeat domain-containing protein n=1 Tax=Didymodactylos carnosus TaxID=1234261 RepID=A0A815DLS9_9BILA|nr:unnamed protein product [Didymodactylos carnosus]CAF4131242.1 unnamed protein product [Didymodactylos carnosus]